MSRELPEEWGRLNPPEAKEPGLVKINRDQAAEIERLEAERDEQQRIAVREMKKTFALQSQLAMMRAALDGLLKRWQVFQESVGNQEQAYYALAKHAYPQWDAARKALATDGKAAADLLAIAQEIADNETPSLDDWRAYNDRMKKAAHAYRKEGRDDG